MSEVYFTPRKSSWNNSMIDKVETLIGKTGLVSSINPNDTVAIKVHFGEGGLTTFLRPVYARPFSDAVKKAGALPFLTDANTIYKGTRCDGVNHLKTALKNGFVYSVTGAPVVIADGINSRNFEEVEVNGKYFKKVKIAGEAQRAKAMIVLSHFKGHEIFGFGGGIKNIGMGLAVKEGKLTLHSTTKPKIKKNKCVGCGLCVSWCFRDAIESKDGRCFINKERCSGCGQCIMVCPHKAAVFKWQKDFSAVQEKTAEYALGALKNKKNKTWFFNFLLDITPECDCLSYSDSPLVGDIGILASSDPVSLDQASYDLVCRAAAMPGSKADGALIGEDKFRKGYPQADPEALLSYAQKIGLGERKYTLEKL